MGIELAQVDAIINEHGADRRALISMLLDIQDQLLAAGSAPTGNVRARGPRDCRRLR
jgi:hypothetical protein